MQGMMDEMAKELPSVKEVLIDERDRYLATSIFLSLEIKNSLSLGQATKVVSSGQSRQSKKEPSVPTSQISAPPLRQAKPARFFHGLSHPHCGNPLVWFLQPWAERRDQDVWLLVGCEYELHCNWGNPSSRPSSQHTGEYIVSPPNKPPSWHWGGNGEWVDGSNTQKAKGSGL